MSEPNSPTIPTKNKTTSNPLAKLGLFDAKNNIFYEINATIIDSLNLVTAP